MEELQLLLQHLPTELPEEIEWSWNLDDDEKGAWVAATAGFDLRAVVDRILARETR